MSEAKGEYRLKGMAILYIGVVCLVVGALCYGLAFGSALGAVGFFVGLAGLALLIIGFVRVAGERRAKQSAKALGN